MTLDFSRRAQLDELMDGPCDYATFAACLADLERVNRLTLAYRPILHFLDRLPRPNDRPLRVLDIGSGRGDMLRRIARWGAARGVALELTGVDLNPFSVRAAAEATPAALPVRWLVQDALSLPAEPRFDAIISSLTAHHMDDTQVAALLGWMDRTALLGWAVSDLHRHPLPYRLFALGSRLLRMHPFVVHDGPVSIRRAFRRDDWSRLLAAAHLPEQGVRVRWWMPFRYLVSRHVAG